MTAENSLDQPFWGPTMPDPFREMFEALKQTAEGMIQANEGIKRMADAALLARDEHEDLRETVARLEGLVLDLVRKSTPPDSPAP
jgi:hypothetical protein